LKYDALHLKTMLILEHKVKVINNSARQLELTKRKLMHKQANIEIVKHTLYKCSAI